jgi:hypothetical protein
MAQHTEVAVSHDPGLRNVMKIVRNPRRWLKNLFRTAASLSIAASLSSVYAQDGGLMSEAPPSGSASQFFGFNRSGFGASVRGGHTAGDTVGRTDSITHLGFMPYFNAGNGLLFGDSRLFRGNEGGLGWSFGSGYRYYIENWDVVVGGNGYYDRDDLSGAYLNQWSAGAELLAQQWEARGNYYNTFGDTLELTGQSVLPGSAAFQGNNLTFTRVDAFTEGLSGFDTEFGVLLPGDFSEKIDLRAFAGGYYYEGEDLPGFSGWSARLQTDIAQLLELGLKLTDDEHFGTTVSFSAVLHAGGFRSQEHLKRSAIQRFREPVRRNMNVVALQTSLNAPGQVAVNPSNGLPLTIAHVNSNDAAGPFLGTVDDPFRSLQAGLGAGTDLVFTHAGSVFNTAPENIVTLVDGQQLIGEGLVGTPAAGRPTQSFVTVRALNQNLQVELPKSPVFAASPDLPRPILQGSLGNAVTLADNVQFSGFQIISPTANGIFSNGAENTIINDVFVSNAGISGMVLQGTSGTTSISNTTLASTAAATGPLVRVTGGSGVINFSSTDSFRFGAIDNASPQAALVVENMSGGRFSMNQSRVTDNGGVGVIIRNNTGGAATIDNLVSTGAIGNGLQILNSAGTYTFRKTNPQLAAMSITGSAQQGVLIDNLSGSATFNDPLNIVDRQVGGIEIRDSSGDVTFADNVVLTDHAGTGTESGVLIDSLLDGSVVEFSDVLTVTSTVSAPGSVQRTEGHGIQINGGATGSLFRAQGVTTVNSADLASISVTGNVGDVEFNGETRVSNRLTEGIVVDGNSGQVLFGARNPRQNTQVDNLLLSQDAGIAVLNNSGTVSFGEATVLNAQGNPGGGAGVDVRNNTGLVNFIDMQIDSLGGTAFFGLNNRLIRSQDGQIIAQDETAVDIEQSGIDMTLRRVDSTDAPDYGIRLVETNKDEGRRFVVRPTAINQFPSGQGGLITGAKGDGTPNLDAAGIFLSNAGRVEIREMTLDDNEYGVLIANTESYLDGSGNVIDVNDGDEQLFFMEYSRIDGSDIRGVEATDLVNLLLVNSTFDDNGDDNANGWDTIYAQYTVALDDIDRTRQYDQADRPFYVNIESNQITSNQHDAIRIVSQPGARGAAILTEIFTNRITVNDLTDPTAGPFDDARPNLDDGFYMDWEGPARVRFDGNQMDMRGPAGQMAFVFDNDATEDLTEMSIQSNVMDITNLGVNPGAISVDIIGGYDMDNPSRFFEVSANTLNVSGATPTGMFFSLQPGTNSRAEQAYFNGNNITLQNDGGTGIQIRRAGQGASFGFDNNIVAFIDDGAQPERGFWFDQVNGFVRLRGLGNQMGINGWVLPGNNTIEQLLDIPANASSGQVEINGIPLP